jgi:hypothetical protein
MELKDALETAGMKKKIDQLDGKWRMTPPTNGKPAIDNFTREFWGDLELFGRKVGQVHGRGTESGSDDDHKEVSFHFEDQDAKAEFELDIALLMIVAEAAGTSWDMLVVDMLMKKRKGQR